MDLMKQKVILKAKQEVAKGLENNPELSLKLLKCRQRKIYSERLETKNENFNTDVTFDFGDADKKDEE